jgi:hypothetical protein
MKNSVFKKFMFAFFALCVCSIGVLCAEPAVSNLAGDFVEGLPGVEVVCASFAAAAVAIPVYNFENLTAVTQAEFSTLQAKFGKLYVLDIQIDEYEGYQFVVRRPTRQHLELIEANKNNTGKVNDIIIKNLVVSGNESLLEDGIVYARFMVETAKIIKQGNSFLSKA